jgi:hypothetical protein
MLKYYKTCPFFHRFKEVMSLSWPGAAEAGWLRPTVSCSAADADRLLIANCEALAADAGVRARRGCRKNVRLPSKSYPLLGLKFIKELRTTDRVARRELAFRLFYGLSTLYNNFPYFQIILSPTPTPFFLTQSDTVQLQLLHWRRRDSIISVV